MQRRPLYLHQVVNGNALWIRIQISQFGNQRGTVRPSFSHADDPAATYVNTCRTHFAQCIEAVALLACSNDATIKSGVRINVVVVIVEASFLKLLRLPFVQ